MKGLYKAGFFQHMQFWARSLLLLLHYIAEAEIVLGLTCTKAVL